MIRRVAITIGMLALALVVLAFAGSERQLRRKYDGTVAMVRTTRDSASLARGEHLYQTGSCALCHAPDGGGVIMQQSFMMGTLAGPNLTTGRGGVGSQHNDTDYVRALRRGVRRDGTSMILMPSEVFTHFTDDDVAAIIGYLRQLPPVARAIPKSSFGPMGRALLAAGKMKILVAPKTPHLTPRASITPGPTAEYGRYLADVSGCHGCHGFGLSGGPVAGPPGLPPASNLTPTGLGRWTERDFVRAIREGKRPNGSPINEFMPWKIYRGMNDDDLRALWLYLQRVPPKPFGNK